MLKFSFKRHLCAISLALVLIAPGITHAKPTPTPDAPDAPAYPSISLSGHSSGVTALAWSPDGTVLASSAGGFDSTDDTVRLWHADGTPLATLSAHRKPVASLAWSPDGKTLATGDFDGKIGLWNADGTLIKLISADAGIVFKLAWSPDGQTLASGSIASPTQNTVQWWTPDGSLIRTTTTEFSGGKFYNLGWSPDGKYLVAGATSYSEWRADGSLVFSDKECASCTPAWGFAWDTDSSRWAVGNEGGNVTIYGVDGRQVGSVFNSTSVDALAWSPDGKTLAGGSVSLWTPDAKWINVISGAADSASALAWSPDGKGLAAASGWDNASSNAVSLWDGHSPRFERLAGHSAPVASLAWSPDGKTLASGSLDHTIRLWTISD